MLKGPPAPSVFRYPVLFVCVPGAAVSPGANSCNFTNGPALTAIDGLVLAVLAPSVRSEAGKGCEPGGLHVARQICVAGTKGGVAGQAAVAARGGKTTLSVAVMAAV